MLQLIEYLLVFEPRKYSFSPNILYELVLKETLKLHIIEPLLNIFTNRLTERRMFEDTEVSIGKQEECYPP